MSAITTHILDTSKGKPASDVMVVLEMNKGEQWLPLGDGLTDNDGRVKNLLSDDHKLQTGHYRLTFEINDYFEAQGTESFYPQASIDFYVKKSDEHYHVPLLLNPFGFSTYRGS